ncbi:hypothetical protein LIA77_11957 [Sarocladium implicatum]|nr:hypothetical protein LIA77_11957 [Sarocladium implicatum]
MAAHELGKGRRQTRWGHETHPHNPHNPRNLRRHSTFLSTSSSSSLSASEDFEAEYEVEVEYKNKPKPKSRAQKRRLPLPLPLKESGYSTDDYSDGIGIRYNSDDFSPAEPWTRYHSQDDALQVDIAANELQHRRRHDPSRGLKATSHETDDHDSSQITGRSHARDCSYGSRNRRTVSLSREAKVMVSRRFRTTTLLVMFLTAILLGILSVPPALLHQVVKAHEPIPVPVVATLDKASKSLCHILALTDTPRRKYLSNKHYSQEQLEQRRYRQHLRPHSLVAYIEGAGSANVAFCNHVRAHWHQEWRRERRREDGPCFRTGLGPLQQEDDKFYHPETEGRSYTGYDDFDEYKKRDDDDEDYDINESISPLCTQELQNRYVIPGLDVHDMRRLSRTCRPWTDESLARVKYQVQQVRTVAKSTTKDFVKIVSQLYVSLPGSHWPSLPPSSQIAESTLRSLNTMISFYIQDGDPIYEDELQEFDDAFYNRPIGDRRSTGRRRHVRKNRQASRRAFRTWER